MAGIITIHRLTQYSTHSTNTAMWCSSVFASRKERFSCACHCRN
jgi:hypothetical protein